MNIVIVGDGKVGSTLAEQLSGERHDVTVIDNRVESLNQSMNLLDVNCVEGMEPATRSKWKRSSQGRSIDCRHQRR